MSDLFSQPPKPLARSNVPELSVSELAGSIQRTLQDTYGRVRVRGELSKVKIHSSGHMYSDLKDADACLAVVCWKPSVARLSVRPEEGLEVICTGKITTYAQRSNYQLVIESMELAGEGALLKMLEDRKKRLAAEGLFDAARKRPLPFLPTVIGVVTSPTGAVIRDILHRLEDRFPRHVLVWPVAVQGQGAADQIAAAIRGFDALPPGGLVPRPDLVIVARGGGSLEDLMAFNDEGVVRAAAACRIPLIAAVGHETDTTLIDYAADIRAPTPTAAAEMAVPVRANLYAQVLDDGSRIVAAMRRMTEARRERLINASTRLGDPSRLLDPKAQRLDHATHRLSACFGKGLQQAEARLIRAGGRLLSPQSVLDRRKVELSRDAERLKNTFGRMLDLKRHRLLKDAGALRPPKSLIAEKAGRLGLFAERLTVFADPDLFVKNRQRDLGQAGRMLDSLSFKSVLQRGFVVVRDLDGQPLTDAAQAQSGQQVLLEFRGDRRVAATVDDPA
jgi:exodeoxyribonuclease VII large subunit